MHSTEKNYTLKRISIIILIFACIPIAFIYMFIRDIPLFNSLFIDYVNTGASIFIPFLPYTKIIFQFSTGHLIDIIIVINIIAFIERSCYQYYLKVCLRRDDLEIYSEIYYLETNERQEESSLNLNLLAGLKDESGTRVNEISFNLNLRQKNKSNANQISCKNRYYRSRIKIKLNKLIYLFNSHKNHNQNKNYFTIFQHYLTYNLKSSHFPSKNNYLFSDSDDYILKEEGRC